MQSARILFITRGDVVNGMWAARQRGHGWVSAYLKGVGVPRDLWHLLRGPRAVVGRLTAYQQLT